MTHAETITNKYKQKFEFLDFRNGKIFDLTVLLICCLSFGFSCIESSVSRDSHHWGFMYVQALDLKRGLIPYKETFTIYGILTSWIQSLSLTFFGERLISIGIVTGLFYSLNIFLSYQIFLKILPKYAAFFSILLMFLLHGYITYPWSNYYSYTFFLSSVLIYLNNKNYTNILLSGLCLGLSLLCRYSSFQATLSPFVFFFLGNFFFKKKLQISTGARILFFSLGFLIPILLFLFFLIYNGVLHDFLIQNKIMIVESGHEVTVLTFIPILFNSIITSGGDNPDSRIIFFTIIFFWNFITLLYLLYKFFFSKNLTKNEKFVIVFCLVTLFGYLNAIHIYEVFRLVNSASLGIGVILYTLIKISQRLGRHLKIIILLPLVSICFIWSNSLIFSKTSSVYLPWKFDVLTGKGVTQTEINLFQGKILSKKYYDFYLEIYKNISKSEHSYYIVNYTRDPVAMVINNLPKVQISSIYLPGIEQAYPEEASKIKQKIDEKKAVILSDKNLYIPGYKVVFSKPWLSNEVEWVDEDGLKSIYVSLPEEAEI